MESKTAVVVGATGLLGTAILQRLSELNFRIDPIWSATDHPDVTQPNAFDKLPHRIDVAVYLAGINLVEDAEQITDQQWDHVMDVNLKGAFRFAKSALPAMKFAGTSSFLTISSIMTTHPYPKRLAYSVSKAGLEAMTKSLAVEWGKYGISVNCLRLGHLNGLMKSTKPNPALLDKVRSCTATGTLIEPSAVANLVAWFATGAKGGISGCIMDFDPAYVINRWPMPNL